MKLIILFATPGKSAKSTQVVKSNKVGVFDNLNTINQEQQIIQLEEKIKLNKKKLLELFKQNSQCYQLFCQIPNEINEMLIENKEIKNLEDKIKDLECINLQIQAIYEICEHILKNINNISQDIMQYIIQIFRNIYLLPKSNFKDAICFLIDNKYFELLSVIAKLSNCKTELLSKGWNTSVNILHVIVSILKDQSLVRLLEKHPTWIYMIIDEENDKKQIIDEENDKKQIIDKKNDKKQIRDNLFKIHFKQQIEKARTQRAIYKFNNLIHEVSTKDKKQKILRELLHTSLKDKDEDKETCEMLDHMLYILSSNPDEHKEQKLILVQNKEINVYVIDIIKEDIKNQKLTWNSLRMWQQCETIQFLLKKSSNN